MTTMIVEIYDALIDAGATEPKARRAAEAMAGHENRFSDLEATIGGAEARLDAKIHSLGARLDAKIDALAARLDAKIDAVEGRLNAKMDRLEASLCADIATIRAEQGLLRRMVGMALAMNLAILLKLFLH